MDAMTNRQGMAVESAEWDHNGSYHVVVAHAYPIRTAGTTRAARDLARRVDQMNRTKWTRLDRVSMGEDFKMRYHFTVSRLDKSYR